MRITNRTLSRKFLSNLNVIYSNLDKYYSQSQTGKAFQRPSEDPINAIRSMDINSKIDRAKQYGNNTQEASYTFREAEVSLRAVSDDLSSIKTDVSKALQGSYNNDDKKIIANKIETIRDGIIHQLNKEYSGKYIFGGYNTYDKPFKTTLGVTSYNTVDLETMTAAQYNALTSENIKVQTGKATSMDIAIPGVTITGYGADNMITVLNDICTNLRNPAAPRADLEALADKIDDYYDSMQNHISTIGTKASNVEKLTMQNESVVANLEELLSEVEGVEYEEAITNFKLAEMAYQSALSIGSKIIQPTLVDFLR